MNYKLIIIATILLTGITGSLYYSAGKDYTEPLSIINTDHLQEPFLNETISELPEERLRRIFAEKGTFDTSSWMTYTHPYGYSFLHNTNPDIGYSVQGRFNLHLINHEQGQHSNSFQIPTKDGRYLFLLSIDTQPASLSTDVVVVNDYDFPSEIYLDPRLRPGFYDYPNWGLRTSIMRPDGRYFLNVKIYPIDKTIYLSDDSLRDARALLRSLTYNTPKNVYDFECISETPQDMFYLCTDYRVVFYDAKGNHNVVEKSLLPYIQPFMKNGEAIYGIALIKNDSQTEGFMLRVVNNLLDFGIHIRYNPTEQTSPFSLVKTI